MRPRPRRRRSSLPPAAPQWLTPFLLLALACAVADTAWAQGAAISTNLDLSVRAAGMGRCSNAVFWGEDPDAWSNPALLGYQSGLRYESAHTQLVPDLAEDVFLDSKRVAAGAYGVGLLLAGKPVDGLGSVRLDYGATTATSPTGEPLGTFHAYEDVRSWSIGVSAGRLATALAHAFGGRRWGVLRHVDVAVGLTHKDVDIALSPALPGLPGAGQGSGSAEDRGVFLRVSPYNSFDGPGFAPALDRALRLSIDAAYGGSTLNRGQPSVTFREFGADPMLEEVHKGWAARLALTPRALERSLADHHLRWLAQSLGPTLSLGGAWDRDRLDYQGYDYVTDTHYPARSHVVKRGFEVTLGNVFSWRRGHISDPDGSVHGATSGWSLGFALAGALGFRYDRATVPQATDPETGLRLADVHRRAWSVFVDPVRWLARPREGMALR